MALNLAVKESTIKGAGHGLFTTKAAGKGETIGWYYGVLVYQDIGKNASGVETYSEVLLLISPKDFHYWPARTRWAVRSSETGTKNIVWIYPAPFCVMWFMNDAKYLPHEDGPSKQ